MMPRIWKCEKARSLLMLVRQALRSPSVCMCVCMGRKSWEDGLIDWLIDESDPSSAQYLCTVLLHSDTFALRLSLLHPASSPCGSVCVCVYVWERCNNEMQTIIIIYHETSSSYMLPRRSLTSNNWRKACLTSLGTDGGMLCICTVMWSGLLFRPVFVYVWGNYLGWAKTRANKRSIIHIARPSFLLSFLLHEDILCAFT